jgi:hypothetical protein
MPIAKIVKDASLTESLSDRRLSLARAQQVAREDRLGEPRNAAVEPFAPTSQDADGMRRRRICRDRGRHLPIDRT